VNSLDALIIYLSLGAPFGVYYFVQYRETCAGTTLWVKTLLAFVLWPAEAVKVVKTFHSRKDAAGLHFDGEHLLDAREEKRVDEIKRILEDLFFVYGSTTSIYTFREIFERYVGLSMALLPQPSKTQPESEILRLTGHKNVAVGSACLNRRNRSLLLKHQTLARRDLLDKLSFLAASPETGENVGSNALELAAILKDDPAVADIQGMFGGRPQIEGQVSVNDPGRDIWKPEIREPFPAKRI
jgi:hypothetical protein